MISKIFELKTITTVDGPTGSGSSLTVVSSCRKYINKLIPDLLQQVKRFQAGQISKYSNE